MLFSYEEQERLALLWQQYVTPTLGSKATKQFVKAAQNPKTWFADAIIKPHLFRPDAFGGIYFPVDLTKFSTGRNHFFAELIASNPNPVSTYGGDPLIGLMLFANPLRLWLSPMDSEDEQGMVLGAERPVDRVVLGEHHVLTYEFDVKDTEFLKEQLSWLNYSKNDLDCPVGDLYRYCSQFADFAGITVNYSGNKSLHIHTVFETNLARARLGLDQCSAAELRRGFAAHWEKLHEDVLRTLNVGSHRADRSLQWAESFRRLPNGSRVIEDDNLLGFPKGSVVPQITLWEKSRKRASGDELPLFWSPDSFCATPRSRKVKTACPAGRKLGPGLTQAEITYCEAQLQKWYPNWPKFDHLTYEGGRWVAKFTNSGNDNNPSSVMREDYASIHLVGRDAEGLTSRPLPFPLGTMLRLWRGQMVREEACDEAVDLDDFLAETRTDRTFHELEERFRANVTDSDTARSEMETFFRTTVATMPLLLVVGPEGVGKTSVLMALHHEIVADLAERGESGVAMYAFADYGAAEAKCAAFNEIQEKNDFIGVVLPSFSRAYEEECGRLSIAMISTEEAARQRFQSRWAAIERLQPEVIQRFKERHATVWATIGKRKPVFFTVHQVAHEWKKSGPSRLMWAPSFWDAGERDENECFKTLRRETSLGLLVHDEIKADSLIDLQPEEIIRWVEALAASDPSLWNADTPPLPQVLASFEAFVAAHGHPTVNGCVRPVAFEEARRVAGVGISHWDHIVTANTGEYGCRENAPSDKCDEEDGEDEKHRDIYRERHDRNWWVSPRRWWHGLANRVVVLTTEEVPTAVARAADPLWAIFGLEAPRTRRDHVDVYPSRSITSANLATECQEFRDDHPDDDFFIVSNKVSML
ncbi:hypothetical protein, partial [Microvirga sp. CF3016]|uniref:hypothetical protein n=1 Tax=Microvirga sp. CF3016 TaxID=3110181 RepID=UPI002E76A352